MDTFTDADLTYLGTQRLGRLATVDAKGAPQNSPVGFRVDDDGTVVVHGRDLGNSRKFHNVEASGVVSLVVDSIVSADPWQVAGVEIRGTAEALRDVDPPNQWMSPERIVIHPTRIISWGITEPVG